MSSGNRSQVTPAGTAPIAKGDKVAASTIGKKKAQVNRAKGSKWEQSTSSKRKVIEISRPYFDVTHGFALSVVL